MISFESVIVGALVFDDHDIVEVTPHRSHGRVMQILQAVVTKNHALRAETDQTPNAGMLNRAIERAFYDGTGHSAFPAPAGNTKGA